MQPADASTQVTQQLVATCSRSQHGSEPMKKIASRFVPEEYWWVEMPSEYLRAEMQYEGVAQVSWLQIPQYDSAKKGGCSFLIRSLRCSTQLSTHPSRPTNDRIFRQATTTQPTYEGCQDDLKDTEKYASLVDIYMTPLRKNTT